MTLLTEGTDYEIVGVASNGVYNEIAIRTINTVDAADTIAVDLTKYGINATGLIGVDGYEHTTANSITVHIDPTTAVSSGTVTITPGAGGDNRQRYFFIKGFTVPNPSSAL